MKLYVLVNILLLNLSFTTIQAGREERRLYSTYVRNKMWAIVVWWYLLWRTANTKWLSADFRGPQTMPESTGKMIWIDYVSSKGKDPCVLQAGESVKVYNSFSAQIAKLNAVSSTI